MAEKQAKSCNGSDMLTVEAGEEEASAERLHEPVIGRIVFTLSS